MSSPVRGILQFTGPALSKSLDYLTIATTGNSQKFGDLVSDCLSSAASYSSPTRGVFAGIRTPTVTNTIEYIIIQTEGNAVDFGDLTQTANNAGGCSNAHGGL